VLLAFFVLVVTYITDYWPLGQRFWKFLKIQRTPASWQAMMVEIIVLSWELFFFS